MNGAFHLPELPFPAVGSPAGVWRRDEQDGGLAATAAGHTDLYVNPAGPDSTDAESLLNAATLLGTPPAGDFQLSARVSSTASPISATAPDPSRGRPVWCVQ